MSIIDAIFQAGVVGCGGAGFPTHQKLSGQGIRHLIINGAECEPLLGTDRWLMRSRPGDIVAAAAAVAKEIGAEDCTIGLKKSYTREIVALETAIRKLPQGAVPVRLHTVESFYPAGDEQVLVYEVTGKVVPPASPWTWGPRSPTPQRWRRCTTPWRAGPLSANISPLPGR